MHDINDLLGEIGDFHLYFGNKKLTLVGSLVRKKNNIVLEARTEKENLEYFDK